jgi:alkanesulfonate monooxygenase SsuD/methylene tetrahydromethanopterin reductase-like flavin-dependent oxidoreductase (luciferase family)
MDFGIAFPSYIDAWKDCELAEASGFSHGWFYDTQLLCSDVYATMALAAEHTATMKLGTLVAIPSNRIAPVTASAVATLNALAPGRIILGLGTGFTGRNTMGMPALPVAAMSRYVEQVRGLLAGEDVLLKDGKYERWIRLLTTDRAHGCINIDDHIPIHIAANGPKAMAATGKVGEGWITVAQDAAGLERGREAVMASANDAGRTFDGPGGKPYTTYLTTGCILEDGEAVTSKRVLDRVGAVVVVAAHAAWETAHDGAGLGVDDPDSAQSYGDYIEAHAARRNSPSDRRYLDVHEGHMMYLKKGEEQFVPEWMVSLTTLTGHGDEVLERVRELRDAGVDNLALQAVPGRARELIEEFSKNVITKL